MPELRYKVIYRNGDKIPVEIAQFWRAENGSFVFEYADNPRYPFPGFETDTKRHENDVLWEQIDFRVPNTLRGQFPNISPEELLEKSVGKLITDHFEFQRVS